MVLVVIRSPAVPPSYDVRAHNTALPPVRRLFD